MTGAELQILVEGLIDDSIEPTLFLILLNIAKNQIEDNREWEILKTWDRSLAWNPGDTYLTPKNLPTDFRSMFGKGVIYLGEDNKCFPVPYEDIYNYKDSSQNYTIDYLNNKLYILGSADTSYPIYIPYLKLSDELTDSTSWQFPERFHPLLGLMVAGYYTSGVDADDIYARMSPAHRLAAANLQSAMEKWNSRLALMAMGNRTNLQFGSASRSDGHLSEEDRA